jgi:flavin-dependent dehydrogenase
LAAPERSASPAELKPGGTARFGVRRHIQRAPWTDLVEVHWGPRCEAYVTPVSGEEVSVAILWSGGKATFDDLLGRFPRLTGRLGGASALHRDQGCGPLRQRSRGVYRQRLALVGDATGYLDALTGEGLALALHQAFALVEAIRAGRLAGYRRSCRRIARVPDGFTAAMLWVERRPAWRRRLLRALATEPGLFDRFLAIHGGCAPVSSLGFEGVVRLLRGLLVTPKVSGAEYGIHGH